MNKPIIIAGNWKMNLGPAASAVLADDLIAGLARCDCNCEIWVAPSAHSLSDLAKKTAQTKIKVGAQNVHWAATGAFTGELSVDMLKECGCSFAIVGHSERRQSMGESNEQVANRCTAALQQNFTVILCIGETLQEREQKLTEQILEKQLYPILSVINSEQAKNLVIAYEPVWAIGTGQVASLEQIITAHSFIREQINSYKLETEQELPILYGGSVTPDNFPEIAVLPNVNGALVGGASLSAEKFLSLVTVY